MYWEDTVTGGGGLRVISRTREPLRGPLEVKLLIAKEEAVQARPPRIVSKPTASVAGAPVSRGCLTLGWSRKRRAKYGGGALVRWRVGVSDP